MHATLLPHRPTAAALAAALALCFAPCRADDKGGPPAAPRLSGPYTHGNLTLFLIHGPDRVKGKNFLTLDEALGQKKAVVHETQNVNELSVDNLAKDEEVFIQAGDIVKGGQQDRVLAFDLIVPAGTKKMPLASFCVEAGRWTRRGAEEVRHFGSSKDALATKELKLAARAMPSQGKVWDEVKNTQRNLENNVAASVQDARSQSSLQLTLENKQLNEAIDAAVKELAKAPDGKGDVVGYAAAVNGRVVGADVYGNAALFRKLWPKLLKASAVEAVAGLKKGQAFEPATADAVRAFLADAEKGKASEKEVSARVNQVKRETEKNVLFESRDRAQGNAPLRCSYLAK
jgi:hypothetical protein